MECPYCHRPMEAGTVRFGRDKPVFYGERDRISKIDRSLGGIGIFTNLRQHFLYSEIPAQFCPRCQKLIIETDLTK